MRLNEFTESPRAFHARELLDDPRPEIWWNRLTDAALVLGSTQRDESIVDLDACRAAHVDVVRRRSGGGAVLLVPDDVVWFDVILPTAHIPHLADDVHAPMQWLGGRLTEALRPHVDGELTVHGAGMVSTDWSSLVCFDGVGPGEVLLDGRKLVGMSQRRTRAASRLQCCWYRQYDPQRLVDLLAVGPSATELVPIAVLDIPADVVLGGLADG